MRYLIIISLILLTGCGLGGKKKDDANAPEASARERDLAQCEMKALESIPHGPDAAERIERYTLLCMQERGYAGKDRRLKVIIRGESESD